MKFNGLFRKQLPILVITLILMLILVGCNGATNASSNAAAPGNFKVAMVLPGPIDDQTWNTSGYDGLKLIEKELGAQVAYTASVPEEDYQKALRQYAEEGYDFIIAHGGQFLDAAEVVSEEFPRTKFVVMTAYAGNNKNLGALTFRDGEMGYLAGVVAALKTESNKVAFVGGQPFDNIVERSDLFERGAKSINPDIDVSIEWVNSWDDLDRAAEIADQLLADGVDVIAVNANAASVPVHKAAEAAGAYTIGWNLDNRQLAPNSILTTAVQHVPLLQLEATLLVEQGRWEGKHYKFGLHEGVQELASFNGLLTPEQEARVNEIKEEIMTGKIDVSPQ